MDGTATGKTITITLDGTNRSVTLPLLDGSIGPSVADIRKLYSSLGIFTFDPGFGGTASCHSSITYIDGDEGVLLYRGYPIEQLAEHSTFLEVCYLLLNGELLAVWQIAVDQQIGDLGELCVLGQLLDRVAAVAQDACLAVEEGDRALTGGGRHEGGVVEPDAREQLRELGSRYPSVRDGDLTALPGAVVRDRDRLRHFEGLLVKGGFVASAGPMLGPRCAEGNRRLSRDLPRRWPTGRRRSPPGR